MDFVTVGSRRVSLTHRHGRETTTARSPIASAMPAVSAKVKKSKATDISTSEKIHAKARESSAPLSLLEIVKNEATPGIDDFSSVKKNEKGGVLVSTEEIQAAFKVLDPDNTGAVTLPSLKKVLGVFYPEMTAKEFRFLMNNQKSLSLEDIERFVKDNEIQNFDPVAEAFNTFDTKKEGSISNDRLRELFLAFDMGELSTEELDLLKRSIDVNNDGNVDIEDFRFLIENPQGKRVDDKKAKR